MDILFHIPEDDPKFVEYYKEDKFNKIFMHIFVEMTHTDVCGKRERDALKMMHKSFLESKVVKEEIKDENKELMEDLNKLYSCECGFLQVTKDIIQKYGTNNHLVMCPQCSTKCETLIDEYSKKLYCEE